MFRSLFKPNPEKLYEKRDIEGLLKALSYGDLDDWESINVRDESLEYLRRTTDPRALGSIIEILQFFNHTNDRVRKFADSAAKALGSFGDLRAVKPLLDAFFSITEIRYRFLESEYEDSNRYRESCISSASKIDSRLTYETLLANLAVSDVRRQTLALDCIHNWFQRLPVDDRFAELTEKLLEDHDASLRMIAAKILYRRGVDRGTSYLRNILINGDIHEATKIVQFIKMPGDREFGISESRWREIFLSALNRPNNVEDRKKAIVSVGWWKDFRFIPDLLLNLQFELDSSVKYYLATTLADLYLEPRTFEENEMYNSYFESIKSSFDIVVSSVEQEVLHWDRTDGAWKEKISYGTTLGDIVNTKINERLLDS